MQDAVPQGEGAMAAIIGLSTEKVEEICLCVAPELGCVVPANMNAPGQIVISGSKAAVEQAVNAAKEQSAKMAKMLAVSVPSHSPLMQGAADLFAKDLQAKAMSAPQIPVIQNVTCRHYSSPQYIQKALVEQMYSPVQWVKIIESMKKDWSVSFTIECGPGQVLKGLQKRIDKSLPCHGLGQESGLSELLNI